MSVEDLLFTMEELLDDAFVVPLSGKRVVDAARLKDLIDDVRLNMPTEIKQAKRIVADRADIVEEARKEADAVVKKAEERALALAGEQEVVKQSQQRAAEILANAQQQSRELRNTTSRYCEDMLRQTEEQLDRSLQDVRRMRGILKGKGKK